MLNEKKVVPKLWQEVNVKVDIVTCDDIKIYYTGKFQDFTARYIIMTFIELLYKYLHLLPFTIQSRLLTTLRNKVIENIFGKGENAAFSPFPKMFSTFPETNLNFRVTLILSSTCDFNFV